MLSAFFVKYCSQLWYNSSIVSDINFQQEKKSFSFYLLRVIPSIILFAWFFLPIGMEPLNLVSEGSKTNLFFPFSLPFKAFGVFYSPIITSMFWIVYLIPIIALFLSIITFCKKIPNKVIFVLTLICLSIMVFCFLSLMVLSANSFRWYKELPFIVYISNGLIILLHFILCFLSIRLLKTGNPLYMEYRDYFSKRKVFSKQTKGISLKPKVLFCFLGSIVVILFCFSFVILNRYSTLIKETVSDSGRTQAEQTAAVYDSAEGKYEKILAFFETQKETNDLAGFPYERIDIIILPYETKESFYLEEITSTTVLPEFSVFAYTTGKPSKIPEEDKIISSETAKEYIKRYQNGSYRNDYVYNKTNKTCKYIYPVSLRRSEKRKLVGFSIVTYRQEVLLRPFFQTKVAVFTISGAFLYLSIFVSLFLAGYIVNPLLYLGFSVKKSSESLSGMMSGSTKISPNSLTFNNVVTTHDEIEDLSCEIEGMVSVMRGILPYISVSTLRNAEKDTSHSTSRDLCFLFTDIRGFTTLCEGLSPKEVVEILNRYLEIETEIILNNGGDVDKYVGDEIMAVFAGPRKEINACNAATQIRAAMMAERETRLKNGAHVISIGIGIHSGKVVCGPVGSTTRMDFTSIGDAVNIAARLEGANKEYKSKSLISESVYKKIEDIFVCREVDIIAVKGKSEYVTVFEILQRKKDASEKIFEIKELFETGLSFYRKQNWSKAKLYFEKCFEKYEDGPSKVFLARVEIFKNNPPPKDWNGSFKMNVK